MSTSLIDFETAIVSFDCPRLDVCGDHCPDCGGAGEFGVYVGTLFFNIAVAAGLALERQRGSKLLNAAHQKLGEARKLVNEYWARPDTSKLASTDNVNAMHSTLVAVEAVLRKVRW